MTRSLRFQLVVWNALTLTALLAVLGLVTRFTARAAVLSSVDRQLAERTQPPRRPHGDGPRVDGFRGDGPRSDRLHTDGLHGPPPDVPGGLALRFFDANGRPVRPGRAEGGGGAWGPRRAPLCPAGRRSRLFDCGRKRG